jgi:arylsulfatase A-like enzyme
MASNPAQASSTPPNGLLVVSIDRLPAWMLPAWGATWVSAPAIDRLAARGLVFDRLLATSLDPRDTCRDLTAAGAVIGRAVADGWPVAVVTDDPELPEPSAGVDWFEVAAEAVAETAAGEDDTNFARLCGRARELVAAGRHRLVWCHAGSLGVAWDAPDEFREAYVDPEDPPPPPGARVPHFPVAADTDPDLVVGIRQVFAGQLTLLDRCLGRLFEALRGMPLGLHGAVGCEPGRTAGGRPHGEWVHLPAILVDPDGRMAGQRYGGLAVPADLGTTLLDLLAVGRSAVKPSDGRSLVGLLESWSAEPRDRVIIGAGDAAAVVTADWHLVAERPRGTVETPPRLFAKPDDFFELSDVADRCAAVVEELAACLEPLWR